MGILMEATEVNLDSTSYRTGQKSQVFSAMGTPTDIFSERIQTIAINTRETEFGSIVEQIPITLKSYQQLQTTRNSLNGYRLQPHITKLEAINKFINEEIPSTSKLFQNNNVDEKVVPDKPNKPPHPPKKKWINQYLEEEPKSPVQLVSGLALPLTPLTNGVIRPQTPPSCPPAPVLQSVVTLDPAPAPALTLHEYVQEHSRPRAASNSLGLTQIPSPPSVGSNCSGSSGNGVSNGGSTPRAGTREVHNKLEKNRRAHLKECFELLKRQLPATPDDKKTSNLSILHSAIRYIQVLRRKERECEHEMEKLAREKIAAQQRLAALKREVAVRTTAVLPRNIDDISDDKERDDRVNGHVLGIPLSITSSPPQPTCMESSPPRSLNLSTKLRTLPIHITPTTSQVVRTSYGARHNTLTLTTLAPADPSSQNGQPVENGTSTINTTLVHPAQIHLPISAQVVGSGGLVVGPAALQLLSASGGLRVLQTPAIHTNGVTVSDNNRIPRENGIVSPTPASENGPGSVVVSGLTPIVVSQPGGGAHLLHTHTLTHKMVETQVVKGSVTPLTVSAQYLSATTIVKPVMVVSTSTSGASQPSSPAT